MCRSAIRKRHNQSGRAKLYFSYMAQMFMAFWTMSVVQVSHGMGSTDKQSHRNVVDAEHAIHIQPSPDEPSRKIRSLPHVIIIGDSIASAYGPHVRKMLEDCAVVELIKENAGHTRNGVYKMNKWLGETEWDVIHFNFGLHDILRIEEAGALRINIAIDEYTENLNKIVAILLKNKNAKLIFATTTPVPDKAENRSQSDVQAYNAAAVTVMNKYNVTVNDLYGVLLPRMSEMNIHGNIHVNKDGAHFLAMHVADSIASVLSESGTACATSY